MGCTLTSMLTGGTKGLAETNPGLSRLITGRVTRLMGFPLDVNVDGFLGVTFPVGLTMILTTGNDLVIPLIHADGHPKL